MKDIEIKHLDLIDFSVAWERMKQFTDKRSEADLDEVWFAEHDPVYTLGHAASEENILFNDDIPVVRTDRGGQVTYHGPGQLMIYFLINLKRLGWGPKRFICELENLIISLLLKYDIKAEKTGCTRYICCRKENCFYRTKDKARPLLPWYKPQY